MINPTSCRTMLILVLVAAVAMLGGCRAGARAKAARVEIAGMGSGASGPLAVHIENRLGEVVVESDRRLKAPVVQAFALDSWGRRAAGGPQSWVAAERVELDGKATLRVLALEQDEATRRPIYIRVRVPENRGVYVRSAGGPVRLSGVAGEIDVQADAASPAPKTQKSTIRVVMSEPADSRISLASGDGSVSLVWPVESRGRLDLNSAERKADFQAAGVRVTNAKTVGTAYTATVNGGTNPVILSAPKGLAEVRVRY